MIPKKIHYCWFGGNPLPEMAKHCVESWKKFLPDYEIVEWNESNFDVNCCDYVKETYSAKKWAFVSDYARFKILYDHGGVYFDTDVEVIKSMDDILEKGSYMGFESTVSQALGGNLVVNPGVGFAVEKGDALLQELLEGYHCRHFVKEDGSYDMTTIVDYTSAVMKKYGLLAENRLQLVNGIHVYPVDYFAPKHYLTREIKLTENTRSIHHYDGTWMSGKSKWFLRVKERMGPSFNRFIYKLKGLRIDD